MPCLSVSMGGLNFTEQKQRRSGCGLGEKGSGQEALGGEKRVEAEFRMSNFRKIKAVISC